MGTISEEYQLSDGSWWTARQLAFELGLTQTACRYRLRISSDVAEVMRSKYSLKSKPNEPVKCKRFELSDGSVMTADECALKWDIHKSTMYARLMRGVADVDLLSQKPKNTANRNSKGYVGMPFQPKAAKSLIKERNYFDPMSRLFLKMT